MGGDYFGIVLCALGTAMIVSGATLVAVALPTPVSLGLVGVGLGALLIRWGT